MTLFDLFLYPVLNSRLLQVTRVVRALSMSEHFVDAEQLSGEEEAPG